MSPTAAASPSYGPHNGLVDTILAAARERCRALATEVARFQARRYPSAGPEILLGLIRDTNRAIERSLERLSDPAGTRADLTQPQFARHVYRYTKFFPFLHSLLSLLRGAELKDTPAGFVLALRRFLRRCLPGSEVIFASQPALNYSFLEIADGIRRVYRATGEREFENLVSALPETFITITFPSTETNNALLHCVIAHEIGHGIYERKRLAERLLGLVAIDQNAIKALSDLLMQDLGRGEEERPREDRAQLELFPTEVQLRAALTRQINEAVAGWIEELASDALGLCLFGPAYYYAFLHFVISFQHIDNAGPTHPAPRLRLKLLADMMADGEVTSSLGYVPHFDAALRQQYEDWKVELSRPTLPSNPLYRIVSKAIAHAVPREIAAAAIAATDGMRYTQEGFRGTEELCRLLLHIIPLAEKASDPGAQGEVVDLVSMLNSGWRVYLCSLEEFCRNAQVDPAANPERCKEKLLGVLLKSAELTETKLQWDEARKDAIKGE